MTVGSVVADEMFSDVGVLVVSTDEDGAGACVELAAGGMIVAAGTTVGCELVAGKCVASDTATISGPVAIPVPGTPVGFFDGAAGAIAEPLTT
jgi:hypothetical protein